MAAHWQLFALALLACATLSAAVSTSLVINEIDYDQPNTDTAEFIEIKNVGSSGVSLSGWTVRLVNGRVSPPSVYQTISLLSVTLPAGGYFVVCSTQGGTVANCNQQVAPATNLLQNGASNAIALVNPSGTIIDTVSYEGTVTGYSEGATAPTDTAVGAESISRCPDGSDSDRNSVDFQLVAISPGGSNACGGATPSPTTVSPAPATPGPTTVSPTPVTPAPTTSGTTFDHFFIIVLENTDYATALQQPYLKSLTTRTSPNGRLLSNYLAVSHPSEPNYVAMIGGSTNGVTSDGVYNLAQKNIVDQFETRGISWKAYQENYPGNCFTGDSSPYVRKHNPFISFTDISGNAARCAKIVPATQLDTDIANNALPNYSFYTPNLSNDGHDTGAAFADTWLKGFLDPKLSNPKFITRTAVVVIFDENSGTAPNQVFAALVGPAVTSNTADSTAYNHYSLLKTVEKNWGLSPITTTTGDNTANAFVF